MYNTIKINTGDGGWGGPLTVTPTDKCYTVLSVTGGGIHPVAQKIADLCLPFHHSGIKGKLGFVQYVRLQGEY